MSRAKLESASPHTCIDFELQGTALRIWVVKSPALGANMPPRTARHLAPAPAEALPSTLLQGSWRMSPSTPTLQPVHKFLGRRTPGHEGPCVNDGHEHAQHVGVAHPARVAMSQQSAPMLVPLHLQKWCQLRNDVVLCNVTTVCNVCGGVGLGCVLVGVDNVRWCYAVVCAAGFAIVMKPARVSSWASSVCQHRMAHAAKRGSHASQRCLPKVSPLCIHMPRLAGGGVCKKLHEVFRPVLRPGPHNVCASCCFKF